MFKKRININEGLGAYSIIHIRCGLTFKLTVNCWLNRDIGHYRINSVAEREIKFNGTRSVMFSKLSYCFYDFICIKRTHYFMCLFYNFFLITKNLLINFGNFENWIDKSRVTGIFYWHKLWPRCSLSLSRGIVNKQQHWFLCTMKHFPCNALLKIEMHKKSLPNI